MGQGAVDTEQLVELVRSQAKRLVLFDMEETAERNQSVISSVLLGALCGSGVLPFRKQTFEDAIKKSGIAVKANLAAFEDACQRSQRGDSGFTGKTTPKLRQEVPAQARTPALQPLLDRVRRLPGAAQPMVLEGARRAIDYQDPAYAALFLDRVERIALLEARSADAGSYSLLEATARSLALWMTFEDTIRVADLKTRGSRFVRVRNEIRADPGQLFGITEFMKPRVEEIAGTLPAGLGRWLLGSPRLKRWLRRWTGGKQIRTGTIGGFLMLHTLAGFKRWRRSTLRFQQENARIEQWLGQIERLAWITTHWRWSWRAPRGWSRATVRLMSAAGAILRRWSISWNFSRRVQMVRRCYRACRTRRSPTKKGRRSRGRLRRFSPAYPTESASRGSTISILTCCSTKYTICTTNGREKCNERPNFCRGGRRNRGDLAKQGDARIRAGRRSIGRYQGRTGSRPCFIGVGRSCEEARRPLVGHGCD